MFSNSSIIAIFAIVKQNGSNYNFQFRTRSSTQKVYRLDGNERENNIKIGIILKEKIK